MDYVDEQDVRVLPAAQLRLNERQAAVEAVDSVMERPEGPPEESKIDDQPVVPALGEPSRKRRRNAIYLIKGSDDEKKVLDIGATHLLESVTEQLDSGGAALDGEEEHPPTNVESEDAEPAENSKKEG